MRGGRPLSAALSGPRCYAAACYCVHYAEMHVVALPVDSEAAFDGGGLQPLLQTPGVMLPRRGESQISLIKSADLTSWQED